MSPFVQDDDIVVRRRPDGHFDIKQRLRAQEHFLEGPYPRATAETRAAELAKQYDSDA